MKGLVTGAAVGSTLGASLVAGFRWLLKDDPNDKTKDIARGSFTLKDDLRLGGIIGGTIGAGLGLASLLVRRR